MTNRLPQANAFEPDKPGTAARASAEAAIKALQQRRGIFVDAVRATRMAMALTDPTLPGNPIVFANQSFLDLSGYGMEEVLGQQPYFMNGPDTDPEDADRFRRILERDEDGVVETVQYAKSGRRFVATVLLSAFKDEDGRTLHHFLSWADVTRRVDAEDEVASLRQAQGALMESEAHHRGLYGALRESEERQAFLLRLSDALRPLADAAQIQATTTQLVGDHLGADRVMYAEVAGDRGAEVGAIRAQYVRPASAEQPAPRPFPAQFTFEPYGAEIMARRYSGEGLIVSDVDADPAFAPAERAAWAQGGVRAAIVAPLVKDGQLVAEFGVHSERARAWTDGEISLVREVAERTWAAAQRARAEAALRLSEERYRKLFSSMDEAYAVVEVMKDETGAWSNFRFIDVNPAFMQHTGMPYPVGRTATELLGTPNPRWAQMYGQALDTGEPLRVEEAELMLGRIFDLNIFSLDPAQSRVAVLFTDVTERKQAEQALRESDDRKAFLLSLSDALRAETSPDAIAERAIAMVAKQLRLDRCYLATYRLEDDRADITHQIGNGRIPPMPATIRLSDFPQAFQVVLGETLVIEDVLESNDLSPVDRRNIERLGMRAVLAASLRKGAHRPVWVIVAASAEPRRWTKSEIALLEAVAERTWTTIERATAEATLRATEERFRLLVESVRDYAIFTMDRAGVITSWPAGAQAVFGWPSEEMLGRSVDVTFVPEDIANDAPRWEREVAAREGVAPNVREHLRRDGSRIFIDGSTQSLLGRDGRVQGFLKIDQDVTEARRVQNVLAQSEDRLRLALQVGQLAAWDWDLETGAVSWSDEHYLMQGYDVGEVTPSYEAWAARVHPDDRAETEAALRQARDTGQAYAREFRSLHPDGAVRWLSASGRFFFDPQGRPVRMVGAMVDITERREWEGRQAVLVAELQHRTRNLIGVVRSIAGQTMAETGPTEAFREAFNHRLGALARVQGLLSRSDETPITIESLIRMELDALGARIEPGLIDLGGPPARIRHSVVQTMALALHELATNARKYGALSNEQGRLSVRWRTYADESGERLALEWREVGGQPPTAELDRKGGYGRELIERALPYSLNARTSFEHDEAGLRCTIDMPLTRTKSRRTAP